jgi:hypothetical protein
MDSEFQKDEEVEEEIEWFDDRLSCGCCSCCGCMCPWWCDKCDESHDWLQICPKDEEELDNPPQENPSTDKV